MGTVLRKAISWCFVVLGFSAVVGRLVISSESLDGYVPGWLYLLGYFTIQSNLAVLGWAVADLLGDGGLAQRRPGLHAALAVWISVTGLVYNLLLGAGAGMTGISWAIEMVCHAVIPLWFVVSWLLTRPAVMPSAPASWAALIYPVAYLGIFSLEGAVTGKFRYFFLDWSDKPAQIYALVLGLVTLGFVILIVLSRIIRKVQGVEKAHPTETADTTD